MRRLAFFCLIAISTLSHSQDQSVMSQGTAFGKSIVPTQPGQVVNPAGVNSSAWSGKTSAPSQTPTGLGGFSAPQTSTQAMDSAKTMGLAGFGNQAMDKCASYTPGSGDAARDQECAAVNFLSQRCLTPSGAQAAIVNKSGGGSSQSQLNSSYCADSFGKGSNQFNFGDQVKSTDPLFGAVGNAQTNAGSMTGQICTQKTVVTRPAEYEQNTCVKSVNTDVATCSQFLKVVAVQEPGCTPGQFLTRVVSDPCSFCVDKVVYDFTCTQSGYNMHVYSIFKSNGAKNTEFGSSDIAGRVGFSTGRVQGPSKHDGYWCYSTYYSQSCTSLTCSITTEFYGECQGSSSPPSSNNFLIPTVTKYNSYWDNQCKSLEQSAGIQLGTP